MHILKSDTQCLAFKTPRAAFKMLSYKGYIGHKYVFIMVNEGLTQPLQL